MSTITTSISASPVAWFALAVSIVALVVTIWRFRRDTRRQASHDYLIAASHLLEQAFEAFDRRRSDNWSALPDPDRLLWLTVARMLMDSAATAKKIKEKSHQTLYDHARDLWRGKLYDILRPLEDIPLTYFAEDADSILVTGRDQRMCISEKSLRVVLNFLEWPEDKSDPLTGTGDFTDQEIDHIRTFRYKPVGDYLEAQNAMLKGEDSRKDYWRKRWHDAKLNSP